MAVIYELRPVEPSFNFGGPSSLRGMYEADFNPSDPHQAADVVGGLRADRLIMEALQDLLAQEQATERPDTSRIELAASAAGTATARIKYDVAASYSQTLRQELPATIEPIPDDTQALYLFDAGVTARVRERARRQAARAARADKARRMLAAEESTGCQQPLTLLLPSEVSVSPSRGSFLASLWARLARHADKTRTPDTVTAPDYVAEIVHEHEQEVQLAEAAEAGQVPTHTPAEIALIEEVVSERATQAEGPLKAEYLAVKTLLRHNYIPVALPVSRVAERAPAHLAGVAQRSAWGVLSAASALGVTSFFTFQR